LKRRVSHTFFFLIVLLSFEVKGQVTADSTASIQGDTLLLTAQNRVHSPRKASLYSTALPGLGQAYNRSYWKIPIIYGLAGYTVYAALANHTIYKGYRDAFRIRTDNDPSTIDEYDGVESDFTLQQRRDEFRRERDYFWMMTGLVYVLNIVDASVDAHLFYFDVSDKLAIRLLPPGPSFNMYTGNFQTNLVSVKVKL
jgi:hypothetical protein